MTGPAGGFEKSLARSTSKGWSPGCAIAFFGVFLLAGLGMGAFLIWPLVRVVEARTSWREVPCEIVESRVESHPGDDGATYSVEAVYTYRFDGREHRGERYDFFPGSSSGYEGKQKAVDALPAGTVTTCRLDPENPSQSVLSTRLTAEYWLALFSIPFIAVGAGGIFFTLVGGARKRRAVDAGRPDWLPSAPAPSRGGATSFSAAPGDGSGGGGGPLVLEPSVSPLGKLIGIVLVAAFWNGITGVFVWQVWKSWAAGSPDGCLKAFLVPFVLIGLLLLLGVPYQLLALANPRPRLELVPGRLTLGGSAELRWSFRGRAGRIRRLVVTLEGVEEADYRQGTDTRTDRETFASLVLLDESNAAAIPMGATTISIPGGTMHSFTAPDNRIVWKLKLQGEIARWPDVSEELPLTVQPLPVEGVS